LTYASRSLCGGDRDFSGGLSLISRHDGEVDDDDGDDGDDGGGCTGAGDSNGFDENSVIWLVGV
jgi:hypothetical protein